MSAYIPQGNMERLREYKFTGVDKSLVSQYLLTPYWNWLVTLFPLTVAPNLITLSGLALVVLNVLQLVIYDPYLGCRTERPDSEPLFGSARTPNTTCAPRSIYFSWAVGLFLYQSLDAIDGKQARRTGTGSALGEMFDHGCDALNTTLGVILSGAALNLGMGWWLVASEVATSANFYLTTWEEYHTGALYLSAFSGPVEGILMIVAIFVITGFNGPEFWDQGFKSFLGWEKSTLGMIPNLPLNEVFLLFALLGLVGNIVASSQNVFAARRREGLSPYQPLAGLLPFAVDSFVKVLWLWSSPKMLKIHLLPFFFFWMVSFAYTVGRLITAHTTKQKFPWWNALSLLSLLGTLDAVLPLPHWAHLQRTEASTWWTIQGLLVLAVVKYGHFVRDVCTNLARFYDINVLTIKKKGGDKSK